MKNTLKIKLISAVIKKTLLCALYLLALCSWKTVIADKVDSSNSQPKFTSDWFSDKKENWDRHKKFFEDKKEVRCLEVGSYEGRSTLYIATNYCKNKDSVIYAIDTWNGSMENDPEHEKDLYQRFTHNLKTHIDNKRVIPIREMSKKVLPGLLNSVYKDNMKKFDFIYIDGSHVAKDVMFDLAVAWELLNVGGVMIMDDYGWRKYSQASLTPKPAIDGFLASYEGNYKILRKAYQVHIQKTKD